MRRLLFVDDEVSILRALERMLRVHRPDWECHFVDDPKQALACLDTLAPDAIVSDMLMRGLDGVELLTEAARRRPAMARFILTGEVGPDSLVRMARAAHQCLVKPCRGDVLMDVLRHALVDWSSLKMPGLRDGLYTQPGLPVPAPHFDGLRRVLLEPGAARRDARAVALIEGAPGIAAKVLQVATWTRRGLDAPPAHVFDAYFQLGPECVSSLIDTDLLRPRTGGETTAFQREIWRRCEQVSAIAPAIATIEGFTADDGRRAALVAMWHTAAPLLIDAVCRDDYAALRREAELDGAALADRERAHFGLTAAEIFGRLLCVWGLAAPLASWVARGDDVSAFPTDQLSLGGLALAARAVNDSLDGRAVSPAALGHLERLGMRARFAPWRAVGARALGAVAA